jgi:hypothetical protein
VWIEARPGPLSAFGAKISIPSCGATFARLSPVARLRASPVSVPTLQSFRLNEALVRTRRLTPWRCDLPRARRPHELTGPMFPRTTPDLALAPARFGPTLPDQKNERGFLAPRFLLAGHWTAPHRTREVSSPSVTRMLSSDGRNRRKAAVRDDRPEIKPRQGFQMAKVVADILAAHRGTAAAAGHVNSVASSICHAFDQKPREICVLMTEKSATPGPRSRAARPKTYLQAAAGPTDISVLSKICHLANVGRLNKILGRL